MAITNVGSAGVLTTASALGTTSTTTAYTATATAGRLGIVTVSVKPNTSTVPATITDGAGKVWNKITDATGGTGTTGADVGLTRIAKYVRIFDGTESGSVTATAASSSAITATMDVYSPSAGGWTSPISVTANDSTHGSNCTAASGTWSSALALNDWVHAGYSADTDALTTTSAHNIAQSGTTFGTRTARSRLNNSSGNQCGVHTWDAAVTAAGGGTAATTMGFTWASSSCGPFGGLRLREQAPTTLPSPTTVVDNFNDNSINLSEWDRWGGAQVNETGGQMALTTTTTAGAYYGINRLTPVDINGAYVGARIVSVGNQALTSFNAYPMQAAFSASNEAYWVVQGGNLVAYTNISGSAVVRATMPYLSATHVYVAIGIISGQIQWVWSMNGTAWTIEATFANPFGSTMVQPTFMVGTDAVEGSTTTLIVDDYTTWGISSGSLQTAAAALTATVTPSAAATRTALPAASLSATVTPAATATRTALPAATLATTVAAASAADRSAPASAGTLAMTTTLAAGATRSTVADAPGLAVTVTSAADQARTAIAAASLTSTVTPAAAVARTAATAAALSVVAAPAADTAASRPGTATLAITATPSAASAGEALASGTSAVTVAAMAAFTSAAAADLPVIATPSSSPTRSAPLTAALSTTVTPTAALARAASAAALLTVTGTVAAAATRTAIAAASLPVALSLDASLAASRLSLATLAVVVTPSADTAGSGGAAATLAVVTTAQASGQATRAAAGSLAVLAGLSAAGARSAPVNLTLPAVVVLTAATGTSALAALPVAVALTTSALPVRSSAAALAVTLAPTGAASAAPAASATLALVLAPVAGLRSVLRSTATLAVVVSVSATGELSSATIPFVVIDSQLTMSTVEPRDGALAVRDSLVRVSTVDARTSVVSIE